MKFVAITQRVEIDSKSGERRDCLDQAWIRFMSACGLTPIQVPNQIEIARSMCGALSIAGIVLTGGNDLAAYGGDAPERDATENALIEIAKRNMMPIIGVCRGMQMIQHNFGIRLARVSGHVARDQIISIHGQQQKVNSYHNFGATETRPPLEAWAFASDGVVKAVRHADGRTLGIMWHPERLHPFAPRDIELFQSYFGAH